MNVSATALRALRILSASSLLIASLAAVPASARVTGSCTPPPVPFNITLAGAETAYGDAGVATEGGYAYIAGAMGLRVVDVSDPAAPSEIATLPLSGPAEDVDVEGGYAYVAGYGGLSVVDVSDPTSPTAVGTLYTGYPATRVDVEGTRAYLTDARGIVAVNVSTPAAPVFVTLHATVYPARDVVASGTDVYAVYSNSWSSSAPRASGVGASTGDGVSSTLIRLDASSPTSLVRVNEHGIPGGSPQVAAGDGVVCVSFESYGWGGIKVFDVADPGSLDFVTFYDTVGAGAVDVAIDGTTMYVACTDSVEIVDIASLTGPFLLGWYPQAEDRIAGAGPLMLATDDIRGLDVYVYEPVSERSFGASRYETAVELSRDMASAPVVVLATGASYPDALAGAPLAYELGAPILLVTRDGIPDAVAAEIDRLGATSAVVLGGTGALGAGVVSDLASLGITDVTRIAGATRYETAALIAERLQAELGGGAVPLAFIATGLDYPDALAAGGVAARMGAPILLVEPGDVPDRVAQTLDTLGCSDTIVLGGSGAVGAAPYAELPSPARLAGSTRYDTAKAVADYALAGSGAGFSAAQVFVVTGTNFPDALPCGVVSAMNAGPTVLVNDDVPAATNAFLTANKAQIDGLRIVGGGGAISTNCERVLVSLVN